MTLPAAYRLGCFTCLLACYFLVAWIGVTSAQETSASRLDAFEIHVRPLLVKNCISCHGQVKQEGGLRLTTREELLEGGDSGPAVIPGDPENSLLLQAIRHESFEMPPDKRLEDPLVEAMEKWVIQGAVWPAGERLRPVSGLTEEDRQWWCMQPIAMPDVPVVDDEGWARNEIDQFIFDRLQYEGLRPSDEATPNELARRVTYDLTGLPPASEIENGSKLRDAFDYEALVDHLLQQPAYGENQAKYWLDLVRYADSDGYRADELRPNAHEYRDYVIRSFNSDKPYDQFVCEQLAGDEMDPANRDAVIGTMFLRHWIYEWNQRDVEGQWQQILDDVTETTADAFLALGMKCARCHDHKFDPLLQKDYFRLQAYFAALQPREDLPVASLAERERYLQELTVWETATEKLRQRLFEIENPVLLQHSTREGFEKFVPEIKAMIVKPVAERAPYEQQIASLAERQFDTHPDKLPEWLSPELEQERQQLLTELAEFDHLKPEPLPTQRFVATDVGPHAPPTWILDDPAKTPVEPGIPSLLDERPAEITPPPPALQTTGRRSELARWVVSPENPLTARVIVNRIWQQFFGRGLVENASDFGHLGDPPSHPELLDWLAQRLIQDGWSIKRLQRLILTSATYRQSSTTVTNELVQAVDPNNYLLWRMNPRRLSSEEIHDGLLWASGELTTEKRAIYQTVRRNKLAPLDALFDFPDRIRSSSQRHRTTTSTQALMLMNNDWTRVRATAMARRHKDLDTARFVEVAHWTLFNRDAKPEEISQSIEFMRDYAALTPETEQESPIQDFPGDGTALSVSPDATQVIQIGWHERLPQEQFTFEAIVMLRTLFADASVRTIAAHWDGNQKHSGWSIGVTSEKSAYKPRNLILQLVGSNSAGEIQYEVVPSDLRLELNKPYYLAVSARLNDASKDGIQFYLKDLSSAAAELQFVSKPHSVIADVRPMHPLYLGHRAKSHMWDGLLKRIRLRETALDLGEVTDSLRELETVQLTGERRGEVGGRPVNSSQQSGLLVDLAFLNSKLIADGSGNFLSVVAEANGKDNLSPQEQARVALLHALMNSNEMLYLD